MDLKLDINPEEVQKHIATQILNSAIGENVKKAIDTVLNGYTQGFQKSLEVIVKREVELYVEREILKSPELRQKIENLVLSKVSDKLIQKTVGEIIDTVDKAMGNY